MRTERLRHVALAVFGGAVLAAALLLGLSVRAAPAQAAAGPLRVDGAGSPNRASLLLTPRLYLPFVALQYPPCSLAPLLITPTNHSTLDNLIPNFYFVRRTEVVSYTNLQGSTSPTFNVSAFGATVGGTSPGLVVAGLADNLQPATVYYWRAQDVCDSGPGPLSSVFSFTTGSSGAVLSAPNLLSPNNGAVNTGGVLTFTWTDVGDSTGYDVYLDGPNGNSADIAYTPSYVWNNLLAGVTYTWYVRAYTNYAYGAYSDHWTFSTGTLSASRPGRAPNAAPIQVDRWLRAAGGLFRP